MEQIPSRKDEVPPLVGRVHSSIPCVDRHWGYGEVDRRTDRPKKGISGSFPRVIEI